MSLGVEHSSGPHENLCVAIAPEMTEIVRKEVRVGVELVVAAAAAAFAPYNVEPIPD